MSKKLPAFRLFMLLALVITTLPLALPAQAATLTVTTTADSGAGSLRQALLDANSGDTISITATGTIALVTALPAITRDNLTITGPVDGQGRPAIVIDGTTIPSGVGLDIGSNGNTIRNLAIINFKQGTNPAVGGSGIVIYGDNNKIYNCFIGTDDGSTIKSNINYGIVLDGGAENNTIGGQASGEPNVISGNGKGSLLIARATFTRNQAIKGNKIIGNYLGTNLGATAALAITNQANFGVVIGEWAQNNEIGPGNWIGGFNFSDGAAIEFEGFGTGLDDARANSNTVTGNFIGIGRSGSSFIRLANQVGIRLNQLTAYGPLNTLISGNVIAGSTTQGILWISGFPTTGTRIEQNRIGIDPNGEALANDGDGIQLGRNGTEGPGFGSTVVGPGNIISASGSDGIQIGAANDPTNNNVIKGNYIGTSADGQSTSSALMNSLNGIRVIEGSGNVIGGPANADRNVITYGSQAAIRVQNKADGTAIEGNYIGVKANGSGRLQDVVATSRIGIDLRGVADGVIRGNVIGGNDTGINLTEESSTASTTATIENNIIGAGPGGEPAIPNTADGIRIGGGSGHILRGNTLANNGTRATSVFYDYSGITLVTDAPARPTTSVLVENNRLLNNGRGNVGNGIQLIGSATTNIRITKTTSSGNKGQGIALINSANQTIARPGLTNVALSATVPTLSGTSTCANCIVEVFTMATQENSEGPTYLTSGTTDGSGAFSVGIEGCDAFVSATVIATSATPQRTSEFSDAITTNGLCQPPTFTLSDSTPAPQTLAPGGSVTYKFTLTNTNAGSRTFTISRTSSAGWAGAPSLTSVTLNANESSEISITVTVPGNATTGQEETTTLNVTTGSATQSKVVKTSVLAPTGAVPAIQPGTTKTIGRAGGVIEFTHAVTNTGGTLGNFTIAQTLVAPASLPAGWVVGTPTLDTGALGPNQSTTARLSITVPANQLADTSITVRLTVTVGTTTATADNTVRVLFEPGFTFTPAVDQSITTAPGTTETFTYTLVNTGNGNDSFTVVPKTVPTGWTVNTVNLADVPAGASRTVNVLVTIPDGAPVAGNVPIEVTARRTTDPQQPVDRRMLVTVIGAATPSLQLTPPAPPPVDVRAGPQTATLKYTLKNAGNVPGSFTIDVPLLPTGWSAVIANNTCPTAAPGLSVGASCTFDVNVTVPQDTPAQPVNAGQYNVRVRATGQTSDTPPTVRAKTIESSITVQGFPALTIAITPATRSGDPGTALSYTVTVTNTGNGPDGFSLARTIGGPAGWTATLTPTQFAAIPRNSSATAQLVVSVPRAVEAIPANNGQFTVTATSAQAASIQASAVATASINPIPGAAISPGTTGNATPTETEPSTTFYTHVVTNTGSITLNYSLVFTNSVTGWSAASIPASFSLAPGATQVISVSVTAPARAPATPNQTRISVRNTADNSELAAATNLTRVGARFGVLISPTVNAGALLPGSTRTYTHTITNIGLNTDTYTLSAVDSLGWEIELAPSAVNLLPGASTTISVTVLATTSAISGTVDFTRVQVTSANDPRVKGEGLEQTTISQVVAVLVAPRQFIEVGPASGTATLQPFTISNVGNGLDTFDVTVTSDKGWTVSFTLPNRGTAERIGPGGQALLEVKVTVPGTITPGTISIITITVIPRSDPSRRDTVQAILSYPIPRSEPPPPTPIPIPPNKIHLPLILR